MKKFLAVAVMGFCWFSDAYPQSRLPSLSGELEIHDAVIPLQIGYESEPAAVVRVDRIYTEYARKGFFRIGVLPIRVMAGVTFEVREPQRAADSLGRLPQWLEGEGARKVELRQVKFRIVPARSDLLEADRACLAADGRLELFGGVRFGTEPNQVQAVRGILQIAGPKAGQLVLQTTPPSTNNVFAGFSNPPLPHKEEPK
jgi:hypothetical protein